MLEAIILAAGKGTRMRSQLPKVMHPLAGKPLLQHVLDTARVLNPIKIHLVLGHGADIVQENIHSEDLTLTYQHEQLGTGHAVGQVLPHISSESTSLILYGDVPLIQASTLEKLLTMANSKTLSLLTVKMEDPSGYGRIIRNADGKVIAIVEQKDASEDQLKICEVNTGIMAVPSHYLSECLPKLTNNNAQGEYYLTDIIGMAKSHGISVVSYQTTNLFEVQGVNNRIQQAELERLYQRNIAHHLMEQGVSLLDPSRFDCRGEISIGDDCIIDVNCIFEGKNKLGNNVRIGPNCLIKDAEIGDNVQIEANTIIESARIASDCHLGPFARIRPGSDFAKGAKIGNFVETKKAIVGEGSKINHLSYVGDAEVGSNVNIGAGTITCNYDGAHKYQTIIRDDVFIGSNSALVAPVVIENGATIAAGSTITLNVEAEHLAVARERQRNISGWKRPKK
jgi:bifunctional UDP-N-acetylglucosamine pyrophosphorylase/glucosamine-1-phosphate N-acetyltransferase